MLQYSVQLPPLSLSSSKPKSKLVPREPKHVDQDPAYRSQAALAKRIDKRNAYAPSKPLAVSTALPPSSSPSLHSSSMSSSLPPTPIFSDAAPSPVLRSASPLHTPALHSKPVPRSPYVQPMPVPSSIRSPKSIPLPSPSLSNPPPSNFGPVSSLGSYQRSSTGSPSSFSSSAVDVLAPGDLVGEGLLLQNETVYKVPIRGSVARPASEEPMPTFEVVRLLGTGSYAVVYLVREVLHLAPVVTSDDGMDLDMSLDGHSVRDLDISQVKSENEYGREYAIKVLSKSNLDQDALDAQLVEATIHQSLPLHPNIVTLHRTLETRSYLLLLLEFVPGEDLFYFLEQARDHYEPSDPISGSPSDSDSGCSISSEISARTPPTPSLLSNLSPSKLLSRTRLKLIASMFGQMCDAVAVCHERGVFHRDIKPENFIVTDGWHDVPVEGAPGQTRRERRVVVKLTDFGLSTMDVQSADMDCGILINMLYHYNPWTDTTEGACPSFSLFRQNPTQFFLARFSGMTPAVAGFLATRVFCVLADPEDDRPRVSAREFGHWIRELPDLLAPTPPPMARAPSSHGSTRGSGHARAASFSIGVNIADVQGHRLVSLPHSRRPSLRAGSAAGSRAPSLLANQRASWALSRAPSLGPALEGVVAGPAGVGLGIGGLAPVLDQEGEEERGEDDENENEPLDAEAEAGSRSASTQKRRKRGARKGKGKEREKEREFEQQMQDATLATLAMASQTLAREISRTSRVPGAVSVGAASMFNTTAAQADASPVTPTNARAPPMLPVPAVPPVPVTVPAPVPIPTPTPAPAPAPAPVITKKPSKWRLGFGKSNSHNSNNAAAASAAPSMPHVKEDAEGPKAVNVSNVANLLDSLNAQPQGPASLSTSSLASSSKQPQPTLRQQQQPPARSPYQHAPSAASSASFASHTTAGTAQSSRYSAASSMVSLDEPSWARGRRQRLGNMGEPDLMWGTSIVSAFANSGHGPASNVQASSSLSPYAHSNANNSYASGSSSGSGLYAPNANANANSNSNVNVNANANAARQRGVSPAASVSAASVVSASTTSSNWRSSMSSNASGSSSAFTRYSNGSVRSVSTQATSVSSTSWRSGKSAASGSGGRYQMPANVKCESCSRLSPSVDVCTHADADPRAAADVDQLPWELGEVPRQQYVDPEKVKFSQPPQRKRAQKPKNASGLDTISERPPHAGPATARGTDASLGLNVNPHVHPAASSTELGGAGAGSEGEDSPRKVVQKGQINALAKMLSALRR
ncbi:hypothetical protein EIP86_001381 [Pleurotus ostreatoroseus]|nr:hypothetical protein EIP86_001381 [Pleurotus ostreatoroseus]